MLVEHMHAGHRARLKEKFYRVGLDGFMDHEILEYLLTFAIPQKDVNPLAHRLINHFGSLKGVFDATSHELKEFDGIGEHAAALITLIPQLSRCYFDSARNKKLLSMLRLQDREAFFIPKFIGMTSECVLAAFLNNNREMIHFEKMFQGSIDAVKINTRTFMDVCSRVRATGIVIAHNHLSNPVVSSQDIATTSSLVEALRPLNVEVIDHLVVCNGKAESMARLGYIKRI